MDQSPQVSFQDLNQTFVWEIPSFIFIITFSFRAALRAIWNLLKHAELWIKGFCISCQMHRNQVWSFYSNHVEGHFNSQSRLYFLLRNWWVLFNAEVRIYNFRLAGFFTSKHVTSVSKTLFPKYLFPVWKITHGKIIQISSWCLKLSWFSHVTGDHAK